MTPTDAEALLASLTLPEKVSLCAGADLWRTVAIARVGLPALKLTDGPCGARGGHFRGGPRAACFPCGTALGASWNAELVSRVGAALGEEARTKGARVLLAPTVNLHRSPLGGRNFECFSEDPRLTARLAVAYVRGVQSQRVACCIKHFVANDSEFERHTISSEVPERALRELYLAPFEAAVREAGVWSLMSAYNRVNGVYASEHANLLGGVLRGEWGFDGLVVSDWGGTYSTAPAANAGLDLEMPGPARHFGAKLLDAVNKGEVEELAVDEKVRRLLRLLERTGALEDPPEGPEQAVDRPDHRALAREAAAEAIVLLKNDGGALPLDASRLRSLAVVGPNAGVAVIQGGGSARVPPHYAVSPLEGLRARLGSGFDLRFEPGCTRHKSIPLLEVELEVEAFASGDLSGAPVRTERARRAEWFWLGAPPEGGDPQQFSLRASGVLIAREAGAYTFSLTSAGRSRLFARGELLLDAWTRRERGQSFFGAGSKEVTAQVELAAGESLPIAIEYSREGAPALGGLRVGCLAPEPSDLMERAVAAAAACDAAVVVVGLDEEWETEGRDRASLALPGRQAELIERVAAANPRCVVVVNAGAPVEAEWCERVPAVLALWYPGQEGGHALADVLFGAADPGGRLPQTWPARLEDTPAYTSYPGECGVVHYGEGLFAGYRWYDARKTEPRFAFGHGLSYARFEYGELRVDPSRFPVVAEVDVTNAGSRAGREVVQLYRSDVAPRLARPPQELVAFEKLSLAPGETRRVRFELDERAFACWDASTHAWAVEPGERELAAARSSRDVRARARFKIS